MAYYYLVPIDEPHTEADFNAVDAYREGIDGMEERIISELENECFFESFTEKGYTQEQIEAFRSELEQSIRNVPQVTTTPYNNNLKDRVNTYCPPIQYYDTAYERELYACQRRAERQRTMVLYLYATDLSLSLFSYRRLSHRRAYSEMDAGGVRRRWVSLLGCGGL